MTFEEFVDDVFIEHHNCLGLDIEDVKDLIDESDWNQRYKWLLKKGYDLDWDYTSYQEAN